MENETEIFYPSSQQEWRQWLQKNHDSKQSVWLVFYNKSSAKLTVSWSDAVDVALCFGWIDSKKISVDSERSQQFFSKRKAKSTWSKINKDKIEKLIATGLMTEAGLHAIETARRNGSWIILDDVENLIIPKDLEVAFVTQPGSMDVFFGLSKSVKKAFLHRLIFAKRPETRQKRIDEILEQLVRRLPKENAS